MHYHNFTPLEEMSSSSLQSLVASPYVGIVFLTQSPMPTEVAPGGPVPSSNFVERGGLLAASYPVNHIPGANLALGGGNQLKLVPAVPGTLTLCSYILFPIGSEDS